MSSGVRGGFTKVVYSTTSNFAASTEITSLLNGTTTGTGAHDTEQDANGSNFSTGYRHNGEVHTSAITAAFITNLILHQTNCQKLYFRYYKGTAARFRVGPSIVMLTPQGAAAGQITRYIIAHEAYEDDLSDVKLS